MTMKSIGAVIYKDYKKIQAMIEEHGKIRVVFANVYQDPSNKTTTVDLENLRRRILKRDGTSIVAYKGASYKKWSGYGRSCFTIGKSVEDYKKLLKLMRKHDVTWLKPIEIQYGWLYRKSMYL